MELQEAPVKCQEDGATGGCCQDGGATGESGERNFVSAPPSTGEGGVTKERGAEKRTGSESGIGDN